MITDVKKQIQWPNENICNCHLTLNEHWYWVKMHVCLMLIFIGMNKEKEIRLPNKEYING